MLIKSKIYDCMLCVSLILKAGNMATFRELKAMLNADGKSPLLHKTLKLHFHG